MNMQDILNCYDHLKRRSPLIHCITNYVSANDVANALLALGCSPIMADDEAEVKDISKLSDGLVLNLGTFKTARTSAMLSAAAAARQAGNPIVLDPVGIGASPLRRHVAGQLLKALTITAVRGNASEIKALIHGRDAARGVDALQADLITSEALAATCADFVKLSYQLEVILIVSGPLDLVIDGNRVAVLRNGHPMMRDVTGTGCQLSAVSAALMAANPQDPFAAAVTAVALYGIAGEVAEQRLTPPAGNCTYRDYIIDALYRLNADTLAERVDYEIRTY